MILLADSESLTQTARMSRLVWAFVVRIWPKTRFSMARPEYLDILKPYYTCPKNIMKLPWKGELNRMLRYLAIGLNALTHCRLKRFSNAICWKSPISILGTSGYEIYKFLEKNG